MTGCLSISHFANRQRQLAPGRNDLRQVGDPTKYGTDAGDMGRSGTSNRRVGTSSYRPTRGNPIRRNKGLVDHLLTIPIETVQPPRLPPWEIFQRGPSEHQAEPSHPGPHRKIFTLAAVQPQANAAMSFHQTGHSGAAQHFW